ncbi:MAG: hypothetical protein DMG76_23675 [Acidobacteria bacterium]|nr:MAG: hypothetical protein DMG76_23675 [Acidobacteriota bacterium]
MTLSKEQEAVFATYIERWIKIALNTDEIDVKESIAAIKADYAICGYPEPKRFSVFKSPKSAAFAAAIFKEAYAQQSLKWDRYLGGQAEIITQEELDPYLEANLTPQLRKSAAGCVNEMAFGCHESSWLVMYDFLLNELGTQECAKLVPLIDLAKVCGWWAPYSEACIIQDRPSQIHQDARLRLHNDAGPAIAYRDGWKIYCIHGVRVQDWMIEHPERMTPALIDAERNVEVRRVMIEKFGKERYIREGGAVLMHEDDFGKLWNKVQPGDEDLRVVEVINGTPENDGSFRTYFLRVAPTITTARAAVASTYKLSAKQYHPDLRT